MKQPLKLSDSFRDVLNLLENTKTNVFVTGKAGSGKSTLLDLFRRTTEKNVVVLAPTGIAALHVRGQTIHSFFRFPGRLLQPIDIRVPKNVRIYRKLDVLIIDEISMVRADLFDQMDAFLRQARRNPAPFGGVQVVLFGDLFQLPPVVASQEERSYFSSYYDSPYFFSGHVFEDDFELETIELQTSYRQHSRYFLKLLDAIRTNAFDYDILEALNERYHPKELEEEFIITLSARNALVNSINSKKLHELNSKQQTYLATITGEFKPTRYPTDAALTLKVGAQVMFIKNDPEGQFVNGTLGRILNIRQDEPEVLIMVNGREKIIKATPLTWEIIRYKPDSKDPNKIDNEVIGTFKQVPLKLAWAITIHKSQGKTFDKVIIDLGKGAFEHGQTYVALSRCRTLDGIFLKKRIQPKDVMVDDRIVDFYEQIR